MKFHENSPISHQFILLPNRQICPNTFSVFFSTITWYAKWRTEIVQVTLTRCRQKNETASKVTGFEWEQKAQLRQRDRATRYVSSLFVFVLPFKVTKVVQICAMFHELEL